MSLKTQTCELDLGKMPPAETLDRLSTVETDYGSGLSDYALFTSELMPALGLPAGRTVMDVFAVAFDDDAAVLVDYHRDRGDVDQKWERWRATKDGGGFRGQRLFECTTVVKAMMGKRCPFTEYQRYAFLSVKGVPTLLVQFSSQISGVMYSDAFRTESLIVFSQSEVNGAAVVTMRMYGYVQFLKSVWIKGKINSTALSELQEGAKKLAAMLTSALAKTQGIAASAAAAAATTAAADASAGGAAAEVAEGVTPAAAAAAEAVPSSVPQPLQSAGQHTLCVGLSCVCAALTATLALRAVCIVYAMSLHSPACARAQRLSLAAMKPQALQVDAVCDELAEARVLLRYLRPLLVSFFLLVAFGFACVARDMAAQMPASALTLPLQILSPLQLYRAVCSLVYGTSPKP